MTHFNVLKSADLIIDQIYEGGRKGNASDDPLPHLLGVSNSAGFRHLGKRPRVNTLKLLVLYTNLRDPNWPDSMDPETGIFTYYGDRRTPGPLHETPRSGNQILANLFEARHGDISKFPPILIFGNAGRFRDVRFYGLAVPGAEGMTQDEDLVAVWRSSGDQGIRYQNYRARFTILNVPVISRAWISDIQDGCALPSRLAPKPWLDWVKLRKYAPIEAEQIIKTRSKNEQLPHNLEDIRILSLVYERYKNAPIDFERCAVEIAKLSMPSIARVDLTRPWRDGGRDALGTYQIGQERSAIKVEFSLEAKCYSTSHGVGVKLLSRLISRLRHRQFGILVTTSYLSGQAYQEITNDQHPIIIISGKDIVSILKTKIGDLHRIREWLGSLSES